MACGKPPKPDAMTPPSPVRHPAHHHAFDTLLRVQITLETQPPGKPFDAALKFAEETVQLARRGPTSSDIVRRLEAKMDGLRAFAQTRFQDNVIRTAPDRRMERPGVPLAVARKEFGPDAARRNVDTTIRALENRDHWKSREYRERLVRIVEGNAIIPTDYKKQLPYDVAAVLAACPDAGGLVKELTLRGQRGAIGSVSKLGSRGNAAIGTAYELMGTAVLTRKVVPSSNGGRRLHICSGQDLVTFGVKSNINRQLRPDGSLDLPTRRTIECDLRIGRMVPLEPYREIGVDFKHVQHAGVKSSSKDHENQVANVVKALQQGDIDEFHFVTNGRFGESFMTVVNRANDVLRGASLASISCHDYVSSLP